MHQLSTPKKRAIGNTNRVWTNDGSFNILIASDDPFIYIINAIFLFDQLTATGKGA